MQQTSAITNTPSPATGQHIASVSVTGSEGESVRGETSSLKLWQRRYLAALQGGLSTAEALKRANVTHATVSDWITPGARRYDPVFARAEALVSSGVAVLDSAVTKDMAVAYSSSLIEEAITESRDRANRGADRLGNRRLVLEVAGAIDHGKANVTVPVQINIVDSSGANVYREALGLKARKDA